MNKYKLILMFCLISIGFINAQDEKDTIFLNEVEIVGKPKFEDKTSRGHFNWLEKKVLKVYPIFSELYADYKIVELELDSINRKKERKKYIQKKEKEFNEKYIKKLMQLTHTEGRIYKYSGNTTFEVIKKYKGLLYAHFVNLQTKFISINLKEPFDPEKTREDAYIKTILNRAFTNGTLVEIKK
jgi:hypothetical protein